MSKITPWPHQEQAIRNILRDWAHGVDRALIGMATGTGKTITFMLLLSEVWKPGDRAIILVHQDSLMHQAYRTFKEHFPHNVTLGKVQSTNYQDYDADIIFAMVQSLSSKRRRKIGDVNYVILDETHHYTTENTLGKKALYFMSQEGVLSLGCTATWFRADKISLGTIFEKVGDRNELTFHYGILDAVADGVLSKFRAYKTQTQLDISKFSSHKAFVGTEQEWDDLWEASNWADLLYEEWVKLDGPNRKTLAFMPSVKISKRFAKWLGEEKDIVAGHVDGNKSYIFDKKKNDLVEIGRADLVQKYRDNEFGFLLNFGVYTEGADFPYMEVLIMGRPTSSAGLYTQMFGRVLRKPSDMPNKVADILHVGFDSEDMRIMNTEQVISYIPNEKEKEKTEKALDALSAGNGGQSDKYMMVCNECREGFMTRSPGTRYAVCLQCGAIAEVEEEVDDSLYDPRKLDGLDSRAVLVNLLHKQEIKWYTEDNIFSCGIGVGGGGNNGYSKADRTILILPPGSTPKVPENWCVCEVYREIVHSERRQKFKNVYWQHSYGKKGGKLYPCQDKDGAFELADELATKLKDPMLADKNKSWNRKPATDKQHEILERFGVKRSLNRGEASRVISHKFAIEFCKRKGVM